MFFFFDRAQQKRILEHHSHSSWHLSDTVKQAGRTEKTQRQANSQSKTLEKHLKTLRLSYFRLLLSHKFSPSFLSLSLLFFLLAYVCELFSFEISQTNKTKSSNNKRSTMLRSIRSSTIQRQTKSLLSVS